MSEKLLRLGIAAVSRMWGFTYAEQGLREEKDEYQKRSRGLEWV